MAAIKQYHQCRLRHESRETVGWIEARGAKVGAKVELLPGGEFWTVAEVYQHSMPETSLKEHQRMNRRSLPSIEAIA